MPKSRQLFPPNSTAAGSFKQVATCAVAAVDGNTIKLLGAHNEPVKIRLAEIDAPEKKQPFGMQAK